MKKVRLCLTCIALALMMVVCSVGAFAAEANEGDSTTINNYITNNYTYPVTDTDDSGEEGSGTGGTGDVNVNVDVDVNNTIGGYGDTSAYEYEQANVAEALEQIPEVSDGFIGFFTKVFDWLPPPIFGLIVGGLGLAIVLRIAGR